MNPSTCQTCHSPLPDDAPDGICPACLLKRTFEEASPPPPPEEELRQLSAAFPQLVIEESHIEQQIADTLAPEADPQAELRHLLALWG